MPRRSTHHLGPILASAAAIAAAVVAGCSNTTPTSTAPTTAAPARNVTVGSAPPDTRRPDESEGAFVFRTQCAACHGTHGEGNLGPGLVGIADRMGEAEQVALVRAGRGRMPPFAPALSDADIAAVVTYTRTQLK